MSDNHYRREIFYRFPDIYKYLFREEIMKKDQEIFQERLNHHHDELRWLYTPPRAQKPRPGKRKKSGLVPPEGYAWHDALY